MLFHVLKYKNLTLYSLLISHFFAFFRNVLIFMCNMVSKQYSITRKTPPPQEFCFETAPQVKKLHEMIRETSKWIFSVDSYLLWSAVH